MNAQTPYKLRILLYGPTTDFAGANYEVNFINNHPAEFQPIGTGGTDSQIWTEQQWINASKASFAAFDAIVFSDIGENGAKWAAALNSRAVWGGAVNGNIFVVGGDPVSDFLEPSGNQGPSDRVFRQGVRFAAAQPGNAHTRTGLYVALDHSPVGEDLGGEVKSPTDVPLLSWFGSFKAVMSEGAGLRRAVTDHPKLNSLGPNFPPWTTSVAQGFHSWPSGFYPVAYSFDATAPTPTSVFAPTLEADTGYKHPNHLNGLVFALAKTVGSLEQKYLIPVTYHQGLPTSSAVNLWVSAYYRDDPTGMYNWPTTPISWRVISGPNAGKNGACTQYGPNPPATSNWSATYTCTAANVTSDNFQDVVRIFYDYNNNKVFDDFAGNNNGAGDPTAACDFGITLTVNWGLPRVSITATDSSATEAPGNNATFRISRAGGVNNQNPLIVNIVSPEASSATIGQAKAGTPGPDYVLKVGGITVSDFVTIPGNNNSFVDVTVFPVQDNVPEGTETLRLSLADPVDSSYVVAGNGFATAAITDDDQPAVTVSSAVIDGGNLTATEDGTVLGRWVVRRDVLTSTALHVFLNVSGNATRAVDYTVEEGDTVAFTPSGTVMDVTIPAFETTTSFSLTAFEDSRTEGTEYATLALKSHPNYKLASPNSAAINITETDSVKIPVNGYTITQTGTNSYDAYALNDASPPAVVGSFLSAAGTTHAYRYVGGTVTDLGVIQKTTLPGSLHYTYAYGINTPSTGTATIVGSGFSWNTQQNYLPYYYAWNGSFTELTPPGSVDLYQAGPMAVNNANWIVGFTRNISGTIRASRWDSSGVFLELGSLGALQNRISYAWALNQEAAGNRVVGQSQFDLAVVNTTTAAFHAFRTQNNPSNPQSIAQSDDLGNALASETSSSGAYAVNALGEVAGFSAYSATENRAAYKDGNSGKHQGWRLLGVLSGGAGAGNASQALGLNDVGLIVGWSRTTPTGGSRAVVWENYQTPTATDLNLKIPAGDQAVWVLTSATAINQAGCIVGYGTKSGTYRGFLLTPVP